MSHSYFTYILFSDLKERYYVGQTNNLELRLIRHNKGLVKSTCNSTPWRIIWFVEKPTRSEAMILERKLKNLNKNRLEQFLQKYS